MQHGGTEIKVVDNSDKVLREFQDAVNRALEKCGQKAEDYAAQLAPVDTGALRNSITHTVKPDEKAVYVGTNQEYAVYQELGTGKYAEGGGGRPTPWVYKDAKGVWHKTRGNRPHPFIKPAVEDHGADYKAIVDSELKG